MQSPQVFQCIDFFSQNWHWIAGIITKSIFKVINMVHSTTDTKQYILSGPLQNLIVYSFQHDKTYFTY